MFALVSPGPRSGSSSVLYLGAAPKRFSIARAGRISLALTQLPMSATLRLSAELKNLDAMRDFVAESATALHAPVKAIDDLILAVDEATTNIIRHGYRLQPGEIEIEMRRADDSLMIYLRDQAPPFDPTRLPNPNIALSIDQRPVGGLGVYLIRQLVDTMSYRRTSDGRNELTLIKRAPAQPPTP